ncbi:MAG: zinc-dependent alcohol dehydrogenase [Acutalibacteraceae bacterium]|jgi:2-desacetyl-2-hydroxyethyl bacteriochlorophyllide A dehydrogenase
MKAALLETWEHMSVTEIEKPEPAEGQVRIKMKYAGVCGSDITVYSGKHPTATAPVVVGHEIFGIVDAIGKNTVTDLKVGDRVTVDPLISCGHCEACRKGYRHVCSTLKLLGIHENGGYAEYTVADADMTIKISDDLSDELAALAEPFAVGYHVVSRSGLKLGQTALIIGAGPIGMVIAVCARGAGASRVILSEPNAGRRARAQALGFETVDPLATDVLAYAKEITDGNGFDVVFESSGSKAGILLTTNVCKIRGTIVPLSLSGVPVEFALGAVSFKELSVVGSRVYSYTDFVGGVRFLERAAKEYDLTHIISDVMPLSDAQQAIDSMKSGANTGKILIKCSE